MKKYLTEDDLLSISALQHLMVCPRQCALIYLEQAWDENLYTAEGQVVHQRVHSGTGESRGEVRIARALRLVSRKLGLAGQADVVEFHRIPSDAARGSDVIALPGCRGLWRPYPVEYKRGRPKDHLADEVQLCAQALCLEEMLDVHIDKGVLFYAAVKKRVEVIFHQALRDKTVEAVDRLHRLLESGTTPPAQYNSRKCDRCSLQSLCQPQLSQRPSVVRYLKNILHEEIA